MKKINLITIFTFIGTFLFLFVVKPISAQGIDISIAPPIVEALVAPGKTFEQNYIIENTGDDTFVHVEIAPFYSNDTYGNVLLMDPISFYDPQIVSSWFTFVKPNLKNTKQIFLAKGQKIELILRVTPAEDAQEGDYYYTLTFETDKENDPTKNFLTTAKIGSHMLLTVTKTEDIKRKAKIKNFTAPKLIDSFAPLTYNVEIENTGSAFFKPNGTITITDLNNKFDIIKLAPFNVLASTIRNIPCIENEKVVTCTYNKKPLIGIYQSKLTFTIEGGEEIYTKTITTFAFPISVTLVVLLSSVLLYALYRKTVKIPVDK